MHPHRHRFRIPRLLAAVTLFCGRALAQIPTPTAIVNAASNIQAGLPNAGIAQGSIFVLFGTNLGPSAIAVASSLPLPTTAGLAGTSVQVTVAGTTVTAPMIYTLTTQVAAILPSNVPVGAGTVTVTYNGRSGAIPIQVVQSNFGVFTLNQSGTGQAVATFANRSLVSPTNSAKPGDTLVLWGTGLGPITTSDAITPPETDLGTPISVMVGGVSATVTYRGRSSSAGLDQINFVVPQGTSGCNVSVIVQNQQTQQMISNTPTIAANSAGGTCSDSPALTTLSGTPSGASSGAVVLIADFGSINDSSTRQAGAVFQKGTVAAPSVVSSTVSSASSASIGSCIISGPAFTTTTGTVLPPVVGLDAGTITLSTPTSGVVGLLPDDPFDGEYTATLNSTAPGPYKFSGSGGKDVGAFSASLTVPPPLVWTNPPTGAIDRTKPLVVTWTGGDATGVVVLSGASSTADAKGNPVAGASFSCTAAATAGKITVPTSVLLALPPSGFANEPYFGNVPLGTLALVVLGDVTTFTVPGTGPAVGLWISYISGGRFGFGLYENYQ